MKTTEEQRKRRRKYYQAHKGDLQAQSRKYYQEHQEQQRASARKRYQLNREKYLALAIGYQKKLKNEVLSFYSNGSLACAICGFDDIRALSIDHIDGGGNQHRIKERAKGGPTFYNWLKKYSFPNGYQVLCMNCQFIKKVERKEQ